MNIVETLAAKPEFSTLVTAVKAADLAGALSGAGPFTVFAPANAAFEKLPKTTIDHLLDPANKAELVALLKMHVVSGKHGAAGFAGKQSDVATLGGGKVAVVGKDGHVTVSGAKVTSADLPASNGVIHVIDTVVQPAAVPAE